jgi:GTP-binding protein EngB required for normal cell division
MKNETEKIKLIEEEDININENSYNNQKLMNDISFQKNKLNMEEIKKAKENCFILVGKTGTGKTSLLNIIYGENIGKVGYESKSETSESTCYYIKENIKSEIIYYCIIDTPGLYDSRSMNKDEEHKNLTNDLIAKEDIKIKGILFLSNFQNERFDYSEINTLLQYNAFFPLKNFWEYVILIFTHFYGDPDGFTKEELKQQSDSNLSSIFEDIMKKYDKVSNPVKFSQLKKIYVNIHSKIKNPKNENDNKMYREKIINEIFNLQKKDPMFNKSCVFYVNYFEVDEYLYDCELTLFLDYNSKILNTKFNLIKRENKNDIQNLQDLVKNKLEIKIINAQIDNKGNLVEKITKKKGSIFDYKLTIVGGILVAFSLGIATSICFLGVCAHLGLLDLGAMLGGCHLIKKDYDQTKEENAKCEQEKKKLMKELNIKDLIRFEINEYYKNI